jgi:hypothetical protein
MAGIRSSGNLCHYRSPPEQTQSSRDGHVSRGVFGFGAKTLRDLPRPRQPMQFNGQLRIIVSLVLLQPGTVS